MVSAAETRRARSRRQTLKVNGTIDEFDHVGGRLNRQGMMGEARPWRDIGRHFASDRELAVRRLGKQRDHEVFQRDHADAELDQLDVGQLGGFVRRFWQRNCVRSPSSSHLESAL